MMYSPDINWEHLQKKINLEDFQPAPLLNQNWIISFSGGADSVLALLVLLSLSILNAGKTSIYIYFLDHQDQSLAEEEKRKNVIEYYLNLIQSDFPEVQIYRVFKNINLKRAALSNQKNFEFFSSRLRNRHLKKICKNISDGIIITGHSMTDWAETMLMRINRGTTIEKLLPFGPFEKENNIFYFRPLAFAPREKIRGILNEFGLPYWNDPGNENGSNKRSKLRIFNLIENEKGTLHTIKNLLAEKANLNLERQRILSSFTGHIAKIKEAREYRISSEIFFSLNENDRNILIDFILKKLDIWPVSLNWRKYILAGSFHYGFFDVSSENWENTQYIVFRRGRKTILARKTFQQDPSWIPGSLITGKYFIKLAFGRKSVLKIFSELRLSKRQRENLFLKKDPGSDYGILHIPLSLYGLKDFHSVTVNLRKS